MGKKEKVVEQPKDKFDGLQQGITIFRFIVTHNFRKRS